jgi:hypothetical protein
VEAVNVTACPGWGVLGECVKLVESAPGALEVPKISDMEESPETTLVM